MVTEKKVENEVHEEGQYNKASSVSSGSKVY